jgi:hypothetical protein
MQFGGATTSRVSCGIGGRKEAYNIPGARLREMLGEVRRVPGDNALKLDGQEEL